ncbi:M16 family metallopeptidase [Sphingomonas canadensis]|uniref:M16 family metallopeptidase n=1 Tax=Sphingomonas canadensis TaxID=1219257 RepID=A0ABW3H2Q8_9SPHN|nr:pitrilysin family protein [Sphingomonas canadensis]MCW3835782.1 insulinase family protein [Sphingomonas canadensis]
MKRALFLFAAALAVSAPSLAMAQEIPPAPPVGDPKPFKLPPSETYTLPNGMQVTLIPYGVAPKTVVSLRVRAGSINEDGNTWLSGVTGELMKEGAGGKSAGDVATAAAGMGGNLNVGTGNLTTNITMNVLSEFAPQAIGLVADVAIRPNLPAAELGRVKSNLGRALAQALAQPGVLANVALARRIYGPDHPYGRPLATPEQLSGYTIDQVKAFHSSQFGARRAHLYIAGRFDSVAVKAAISKAFKGWAAGPDPVALASPHTAGPAVILVDRPDAPQTTLRLAFDAPLAGAPGDVPNRAMNELLGGAFSSRITTNIREDKGYTYSPGSDTAFSPGDALWTFEADITTDVTGPALKEVFGEIRRMQTEAPSAEESKGIRTYIAGLFAIQNSTSNAVIGTVAGRDLLGLPTDWLETYIPAVLAVTPEQMRDAAAANLPLGKLTLVAVGDLAKIKPQLEALPELKGLPVQTVTVP